MSASSPAVVTPKISVILIAHNQAPHLRSAVIALESSQNRDQFEILVVDSGSHDDTAALGEAFPGITMQRLPENFGATKALNIATRTARGEFLFLLSPEVEVLPDTLDRLAQVLEATRDVAAVCPMLIDTSGKPLARTRRYPDSESLAPIRGGGELAWKPISDESVAHERIEILYPGREALLVRKQFVAGMNYFDERFGEYWADADLAIKIRAAGRRAEMLPGIRAIWRAPAATGAGDPKTETLYTADRILGAANLLGKHEGFWPGFSFRVAAMLKALARFDFALFSALAGGKKVGSQAQ